MDLVEEEAASAVEVQEEAAFLANLLLSNLNQASQHNINLLQDQECLAVLEAH